MMLLTHFVGSVTVAAMGTGNAQFLDSPHRFAKDSRNPIVFTNGTDWFNGNNLAADPDVLLVDGVFRMYMTLASDPNFNPVVTGVAESVDGHTFSFLSTEANPALSPDQTFEAFGIETVAVVTRPNDFGFDAYYVTYEGYSPTVAKIGRATSDDGINFNKHGIVLSALLDWELPFTFGKQVVGGLLEQSVVFDPVRDEFVMVYNGFGLLDGEFTLPVGLATSSTGKTWTRVADPIIERPDRNSQWNSLAVVHPDMLLVDGLWIMAYFGADLSLDSNGWIQVPGAIRLAFSHDGVNWVADEDNIALESVPGTWESHTVFSPSLVIGPTDETIHLFYWGVGGPTPESQTWHLGHATMSLSQLQSTGWTVLDCLPDTNNDGTLTPTDFTAWINAYNNNLPECDQNGDGSCTPTDFTAWIANFNAGC